MKKVDNVRDCRKKLYTVLLGGWVKIFIFFFNYSIHNVHCRTKLRICSSFSFSIQFIMYIVGLNLENTVASRFAAHITIRGH